MCKILSKTNDVLVDGEMAVSYTTSRRVEFADTDMAGLIHFVTFYRMMESVEHEFLRSLGTSVMSHDENGRCRGWPRLSAECEFHSPAYFEDELAIAVTVEKLGRSSLTLNYEFRRDETRIASGRMKTVCCVVDTGGKLSSIEIPIDLRNRLEELVESE